MTHCRWRWETSKGNLPLAMGLGLVLVREFVLAINAAAWGTRRLVRTAGGLTCTPRPAIFLLCSTTLRWMPANPDSPPSEPDDQARPPTLIVGPNGSGKDQPAAACMGLARPSAGCITWGGPRRRRPVRRAIVFQRR